MLVETHEGQAGAEGAGGGYEAAPATELVATRCAACRRPLLDAQSLATAMGPDCREKYGVGEALTEEQRRAANVAIYRLALPEHDAGEAAALLMQLQELGFGRFVERVTPRLAKVRTQWIADRRLLLVETPKNAAFAALAPRLGVVTADGLTVATNARALRLLHDALAEHFAGQLSHTPRGFGVVPSAESLKAVRS